MGAGGAQAGGGPAPPPAGDRVPFSRAAVVGTEAAHLASAMSTARLGGDGAFGRRCEAWFRAELGVASALLTSSCTHALEMAALIAGIGPGDEVIMASYGFVSTANAFALRGATIVFVDIRPDTMNIDETLVEAAITARTRAIVAMHYGGVACEMDSLCRIAAEHGLWLIEDAAHCTRTRWKGRRLGSFGQIATMSFHETKNLTSGGEGGLICLNDPALEARAEMVREKGTDRRAFFRGQVDAYSWRCLGSSYLMSELGAAYLWAQVEAVERILQRRGRIFARYRAAFAEAAADGRIETQAIPPGAESEGHIFYIKLRDAADRAAFIDHMARAGVIAVFHYVPLHGAEAGRRHGRFHGADRFTTRESERLVRLPLFYGLGDAQQDRVIAAARAYLAAG
ncbi:dTDP-4-amino-4,6-dideoxygalactose transaminase [Paralimibaculum aggregatum]|uniref:dTDP-4-amino-4,6-dideoxygalactose transaminase n=1 Tax=Paralimibaculum aggregatum TaxID=3036245 RepID=A0ABQ6LPQ5_9RHOB|nr:dTDP-4-amino-4,6-dideoxygalactose transaminase [Limibaculum sp. NKW23]GMG82694.1 dTDP-4-amino-4,6-dideoxygalactose transaminase [Limibaculum sp. NKW23]